MSAKANRPRPFEQAVKQAEATLAKDAANAQNAGADAKRYEALFKAGVVARQDYELKQSTFKALDAALASDRAAIENAQLQVEYVPLVNINQIHFAEISKRMAEHLPVRAAINGDESHPAQGNSASPTGRFPKITPASRNTPASSESLPQTVQPQPGPPNKKACAARRRPVPNPISSLPVHLRH